MARKKLSVSKWYGGMSNDPSVWSLGSFFDGRGVEIRKDSGKFTLSSNFGTEFLMNSRSNGHAIGAIIPSTSNNVYATADGRLANVLFSEATSGQYYVDATHTSFSNIFEYQGVGRYGVVITNAGILRWLLDTSRADLGTLGDDMLVNGDFGSSSGWTVGSNWTISWGDATHSAGSTAALWQLVSISDTSKYVINAYATVSAGSVTVSLWGTNLGTLTSSTNGVCQVFAKTTSPGSEQFNLTPSNDFVGSVHFVKMQKSNVTVALTHAFASDTPIHGIPNFLFVGNGSVVTRIDTSLSTWSSADTVTIANGFTVKGISQVGDQIYIYATNGSEGKQYVWDGVSSTPSGSITWYDKPIQRVLNLNNVDYLVTKTRYRSSLFMANGYQPAETFKSPNVYVTGRDRFDFDGTYLNAVETIGNTLVIPCEGGLYTYGNGSPGYPKAILKEFTWNGGIPSVLYYSEPASGNLYAFYKSSKSGSSKNYARAIYLGDEKAANRFSVEDPGFIRLHPYSGAEYSQEKSSVAYKIGASVPSGCGINVYSRADEETGYATFYVDGTANAISVKPTKWATYTNGGNTYTVDSVTNLSAQSAIIHCTYSGTASVAYSGTLAKSSGTGDSSIVFFRSNEFKLVDTIAWPEVWGEWFKHSESYHSIEWIIEPWTTSATKTPEIFNLKYVFEETKQEF